LTQYDAATEKQLRILKLITWMLMFVGPAAYLVVALVMDSKGVQARAGNEMMLYLMLAVSLLSPLVLPLVTKSVIRSERAKRGPEVTPAQIFQVVSIVQMSCVEAIYIYGLVVFQLTGKIAYMLCFYPIGIAWSFVYWPKREKYERLVEKLNQP
jgi:hypothetical protein